MNLLLIGVAGALGALARYGLGVFVLRYTDSPFPWHTVIINMLGCFLFGVVFAFFDGRANLPPEWRLIILTGFLGAFTTYSTFAFESAALIRESQYVLAAANVLVQNVLGIVLVFAGIALNKWITA